MNNDEIREETECKYIALLYYRKEALQINQIKPKYLHYTKNQKILKAMIYSFKKYGVVAPTKFLEAVKDFDFVEFERILNETLVLHNDNNWRKSFDTLENEIFTKYKQDVIKGLNKNLEDHKITYEKFMELMSEIRKVNLKNQTTTITKKELEENIVDKVQIKLNNSKTLNSILQLTQGDFLIIGATTGVGKSGFMLNMMNDLMNRYQCIYFNMEMSKATIYKRLIAIRADVPVENVNAPQTSYQKGLIDKAMEELEKANLIIEHKANDVNKIESIISKNKIENKHTIVFIDHLGLTKVDNKKNLYEQATEVAKVLRQICLEYDCTIISASQLNRGAYNSEELNLSMLKDSGELENSASKVILLRRNKDSDKESKVIEMDVEVAKNRDGFTGVMQMKYDKTKQIFKEI